MKKLILGPGRVNVVPFVGAGLSAYGTKDIRLPGWGQLVEKILERAEKEKLSEDQAARIRNLYKKGQYIDALNMLYTTADSDWVNRTIEKLLDIKEEGLSPASISLMTITWSLVVTTNLDRMLELAYESLVQDNKIRARDLKVFTHKNLDDFTDSMSFEQAEKISLAKIHGTVEDYESFVLSTQHYQNLLLNNRYNYLLQDLFRRNLLIIGFSLNDPDFDRALEHIADNYRNRNAPPYVILPKGQLCRASDNPYRKRIEHLQSVNDLQVITYNVDNKISDNDPWSGHRELFECLRDLSNTWLKQYHQFRVLGSVLVPEQYFVGRRKHLSYLDKYIFKGDKACQVLGFGGEGKSAFLAVWLARRRERLSNMGVKDAFVFECYSHSPSAFFKKASQQLNYTTSGHSVAEHKSAIMHYIQENQTLFVFDGFEVFQNQDGTIRDPQLNQFVEDVIEEGSYVIITSRIAVPHFKKELWLPPLDEKEVIDLVAKVQTGGLHPTTHKRLYENLKGHAQSTLIYLQSPDHEKINLDDVYIADLTAENSLTANKAEQTLIQIQSNLSSDENALLKVISVFDRPVPLPLVRDVLKLQISDFKVSFDVKEQAFTELVDRVIEKKLVISQDGMPTYALHPNVRDFFRKHSSNSKKIHRKLCEILKEKASPEPIKTFEDAESYIRICFHAAHAKDWKLFDYYYQNVLMRGQEDYLCDTLGCWSETLDLTRNIFTKQEFGGKPKLDAAYYLSRYARSLKHLGHGVQATEAYNRCLKECSKSEFEKTAIYLNNYLTLQIYMGNLDRALRLTPWNFATFQWIKTDKGVRNQQEHGGYSIGWLAMLRGDFEAAQKLFNYSENAWSGSKEPRQVFFDYYPVYFAEMFLIVDKQAYRAQEIIERYLISSQQHSWRETEARCHIASSLIYRSKAKSLSKPQSYFDIAKSHCERANEALSQIFAPPVEIELLIEELCIYYQAPEWEKLKINDAKKLSKLQQTLDALGWNLYLPDTLALRGLSLLKRQEFEDARRYLAKAFKTAKEMGNVLAIQSPYKPISILNEKLGKPISFKVKVPSNEHSLFSTTEYASICGQNLKKAVTKDFHKVPKAKNTD